MESLTSYSGSSSGQTTLSEAVFATCPGRTCQRVLVQRVKVALAPSKQRGRPPVHLLARAQALDALNDPVAQQPDLPGQTSPGDNPGFHVTDKAVPSSRNPWHPCHRPRASE